MTDLITILLADDDDDNLFILGHALNKTRLYTIVTCRDGAEAWQYLEQNAGKVHIALLDIMMPRMTGMEVATRIQQHPTLKYMPVIFQSGKMGLTNYQEALNVGVYYYLTKPFTARSLLEVIYAIQSRLLWQKALYGVLSGRPAPVTSGEWQFGQFSESLPLIAALALASSSPVETASGLAELALNAIEHGNLHIGWHGKHTLLKEGNWEAALQNQAKGPSAEKKVTITAQEKNGRIYIAIGDEGKGFPWSEYMQMQTSYISQLNGRGIIFAKTIFPDLTYQEYGSKALCSFEKGLS